MNKDSSWPLFVLMLTINESLARLVIFSFDDRCILKDMNTGDLIYNNCIRNVRPGCGLQPSIIASKYTKSIRKYIPVIVEFFKR